MCGRAAHRGDVHQRGGRQGRAGEAEQAEPGADSGGVEKEERRGVMENKEAAFVCTKCGAEVNFCDVDQCLCHTVFIFYATGEVMPCGPCGPCQIKTEWALAHMAKQEADLMSSASHISALEAKCGELEQQLAETQEQWTNCREKPKNNGSYLVAVNGKITVASFFCNGWYFGYYNVGIMPTHWRKMPPLPEGADK